MPLTGSMSHDEWDVQEVFGGKPHWLTPLPPPHSRPPSPGVAKKPSGGMAKISPGVILSSDALSRSSIGAGLPRLGSADDPDGFWPHPVHCHGRWPLLGWLFCPQVATFALDCQPWLTRPLNHAKPGALPHPLTRGYLGRIAIGRYTSWFSTSILNNPHFSPDISIVLFFRYTSLDLHGKPI